MFTFKSIINSVINSESTAVKVVGYTALAAVGIGADIIGASAKKVETKVATEKVTDEDIVMEVVHDEDIVMEVVHDEDILEEVHDEDILEEVVRENPVEEDPADVEFENELFDAAIKSTSNSFVMACEEAIELKENGGNEEEAIETEKMAKCFLDYLHLSLGKEDECLMVHNAKEALAAFRTFGPNRIEWM